MDQQVRKRLGMVEKTVNSRKMSAAAILQGVKNDPAQRVPQKESSRLLLGGKTRVMHQVPFDTLNFPSVSDGTIAG